MATRGNPMIEIETTVRGGLPVLAQGRIGLPEPDVGFLGCSVYDIDILWLSGHVCNLPLSEADYQRIYDEILESARDLR